MSPVIQFTFFHYLFIASVVFACAIIGGRITVRFKYHSFWERFSVSTSLGLGLLALSIFFLGLVKALYSYILVSIFLAALIVSIATWPGLFKIKRLTTNVKSSLRKIKSYTILWLTIIASIFIATCSLPLYPPTFWDSIEYHLAVAKIYAQSHALIFTPYLRFPVNPQLNQMLFTGGFVVYDEISAHLIEYAMLLLIPCALYAFSRRYFSPWVGILASALWLGSPFSIQFGSVGYIDIGLTLFSLLSIYLFINYFYTNDDKWLVLSGVFLGFSAAVKYTGLFYVLVCGMLSIWIAYKKHDYLVPVKLGIAILVIAAPFYIRNYYYSGNPFFPFFSNIFDQRIWSDADIAGLLREQSSFGIPKNIISVIKMPWYLIYKPNTFFSELGDRLLFSPAYFLAFLSIPVMFFFKKTRLLSIFSISFILFWFETTQIIRYVFPVVPLLSIITSISIYYLLRQVILFIGRRDRNPKFLRVSRLIVIAALASAFALPSITFSREMHIYLGPIPVTETARAQYLERFLPTYPAYRLLNEQADHKYSVYAFFDENMAYFANGSFMGDWFGPARYSQVENILDNDTYLFTRLQQLGANYFLINIQRFGHLPEHLLDSAYFQILTHTKSYILFRLADRQ